MLNLKDLGTIIKKDAPLLASVLLTGGSPLTAIATLMLNEIAHYFGADATNIQDLATKISGDPESPNKLKEIENRHQEMLAQYQNENVDGARKRENDMVKSLGRRDYILDFLSIVVMLTYTFSVVFISLKPDQFTANPLFYTQFALNTIGFFTILRYYYGIDFWGIIKGFLKLK